MIRNQYIYFFSAALFFYLFVPLPAQAQSSVLFQDSFETPTLKPEWDSTFCCQSVQNGWLHTQDIDGWPRDSQALVHDSDPTWTDYRISVTADFADGSPWEHINILLRSDNFKRSSGTQTGTAYQLEFTGSDGWNGTGNAIELIRTNHDLPPGNPNGRVILHHQYWNAPKNPFAIQVTLRGSKIQLTINGQTIFDIEDPNPLRFGGVGIHAIWESEARIDNLVVSTLSCAGIHPELSALITNKSGSKNSRAWILAVSNISYCPAENAQIDGLTLTQSAGTSCIPVITSPLSFPLGVGNIPAGSQASGTATIDFTGCPNNARFKATIPFSSNIGEASGSKTLNNQFR